MLFRKTPKLFTRCLQAVCLFFFFFTQTLAQHRPVTKADSMVQLLYTMKDDTSKVNLLDKLSQAYEAGDGKQKMMLYASQELELAQRLGWNKGQVNALTGLGQAYARSGDIQKAITSVKQAYELAKKTRLIDQQYILQLWLANLYAGKNDYTAALGNAKAVLDYYLQFRSHDVNASEWNVHSIWWESAYRTGDFYSFVKTKTAGLEFYRQLLNRFTKQNDSLGIRTALDLLIRYSNFPMKDYEGARKYCMQELKYFRVGDTSAAHAAVITYIADTYRLQNNYVKALEYYRMAMALRPDARIEVRNLANSGMREIYFLLGDYSKALDLDLEQLSYVGRIRNENFELLNFYTLIADDYSHLQKYNQSLFYLNKKLKLNDSLFGSMTDAFTLLYIANLYYLTHHYDEALLKIGEITRTKNFEESSWEQNLSLLYKGKIVRDAPDSVLRKHGILPATKYRQSAGLLQKALVYFSGTISTDYKLECYKEMSATYDSLKDYLNFYSTYTKYIALRDSSVNRENQNAFISKLAGIRFEKIEDSLRYQQRLTNDKLKQQTLLTAQQRKYYISGIVALLALSFFIGRNYYNQRKANRTISVAKQRSDTLLLNILPADVAEELKEKGSADARLFEDVTVLFTDFVNFTTISELLTPQELVDELHYCFKVFDEIIGRYGIEKIKTIGDAYLAVAGLPNADVQHALKTVNAALEIRQFIYDRKQQMGNRSFGIRIGIHSGSVVAGIVGVKKFAYDIWGDTVNTAARMEQYSLPGQINVSEKTYELVKDQFAFAYRGEIEAKNKGALKMYFLEKQSLSVPV